MELAKEDIEMIRSLRTYAFNYDDCDDMLQDIYLKILNNLSKFNSLTTAEKRNYVIRAIKNWGIDKNRRNTGKGRVKYHVDIDLVNSAIDPDVYAKIELKEVMKKGKGAFKHFSSLMLLVHGYTCNEISEMTDTNLNTVLGRFRYARIFLNK